MNVSRPAESDPSRPSVLLVEDEESIAEPFARALTRSGLPTTVARTRADALALAAEFEPTSPLLSQVVCVKALEFGCLVLARSRASMQLGLPAVEDLMRRVPVHRVADRMLAGL